MTKREKFEVIGKVFGELENANKDEILEFVNKEIAALDAKSAKASKKAAEKKVAGNELGLKIRDVVFAANEPMTIADIINALPNEGLTPAKVAARMKGFVAANDVAKETVKVDGRKVVAYAKA